MREIGVVAAIVAACALAGCGGGSGDADAPEGPGPLAELMGWEPQEPAEIRRKELAREELVAECMREEGWEYQPVDWSAQMPETGEEDVDLMMNDPEAYGEKYGYGVVHNYELFEEEGLLSGDGERGMGMEIEDPNQEYVQSLSPAEMEEYYATLHGEPMMEPEEDEDVFVAPPLEEQGCYGRAQLEVYGENPMESDPDLQERLNDFWTGQQDDPRIEQAAAEWVACMDDTIAGLEVLFEPIDHPDDMYQYLDQLKMEAMGLEAEPFDDSDPDAWSEDVYTVMSVGPDPDSPQIAYVGKPEAIPEAELEELRARELEVWQFDDECQDDVDFAELRRRIEEEFVDELRADFPELADANDAAGDDAGS